MINTLKCFKFRFNRQKSIAAWYFCIIILLISFWGVTGDSGDEWILGDKTKFTGGCKRGISPVNIDPKKATKTTSKRFMEVINFHAATQKAKCINNGYTIACHLQNPEYLPAVQYGELGFPDHIRLNLDSIHFHWTSLHTLNGKRYPLEVHFVHINDRLKTLDEALTARGVVILVSFIEPAEIGEYYGLIHPLNELKQKDDNATLLLDLIKFLPDDFNDYFVYNGTPTNPPCAQEITWVIFENTRKIARGLFSCMTGEVVEDAAKNEPGNVVHHQRRLTKSGSREITWPLETLIKFLLLTIILMYIL